MDSLVGIKEYKEIQDNFIKESNILEIDPNTRYKIEIKDKDYCILSYGNDEKNTIKVPKEIIPFELIVKKIYIIKMENLIEIYNKKWYENSYYFFIL